MKNDLEASFEQAQKSVITLSKAPSNEILLDLYSLYKQGSLGDVQGKRPGMLDLKGRAKFDAWFKRQGMSRNEAMKAYVDLVDRLLKT